MLLNKKQIFGLNKHFCNSPEVISKPRVERMFAKGKNYERINYRDIILTFQ